MAIELKNIVYETKDKLIIKDISGKIEKEKTAILFGPNGSGKTVLFKIISGIISQYSGDVFIDGKNIRELKKKELSNLIGYVPPNSHSVFNFKVIDFILMGKVAGENMFYTPTKDDRQKAEEILSSLGIEHLKDRNYNNISTGEKQLVLISKYLIKNLPIILMDEPVSNLDFYNQHKFFSIINKLNKQGVFVIVSIHDPTLALNYGKNIILLNNGRIYDIINMDEEESIDVFSKYLEEVYSEKTRIIQNSNRYFVDML